MAGERSSMGSQRGSLGLPEGSAATQAAPSHRQKPSGERWPLVVPDITASNLNGQGRVTGARLPFAAVPFAGGSTSPKPRIDRFAGGSTPALPKPQRFAGGSQRRMSSDVAFRRQSIARPPFTGVLTNGQLDAGQQARPTSSFRARRRMQCQIWRGTSASRSASGVPAAWHGAPPRRRPPGRPG